MRNISTWTPAVRIFAGPCRPASSAGLCGVGSREDESAQRPAGLLSQIPPDRSARGPDPANVCTKRRPSTHPVHAASFSEEHLQTEEAAILFMYRSKSVADFLLCRNEYSSEAEHIQESILASLRPLLQKVRGICDGSSLRVLLEDHVPAGSLVGVADFSGRNIVGEVAPGDKSFRIFFRDMILDDQEGAAIQTAQGAGSGE